MTGLVRYFVERPLFANLMSAFILLAGGMGLFLMKREFFPNINFEVITVTTPYPGASAADVEKKITNPLEEDLQEIENVRRFTSVSSEGMSVLVIELDPDHADEIKAERDIQNIVDRFEDLPEDAKEPIVSALEFGDTPLVEIAVKSDLPELELRRMARLLERKIENIRGVARVEPRGLLDEEIRVEVLPPKLKAFRVSINEVIDALKQRNISLPGGIIEGSESAPLERIIRTTGDFESLQDVEEAVVRANDLGAAIHIKDIAKVSWGLEKKKMVNRVNGEPAVSLIVVKSEPADAISLRDVLKEWIEANREAYKGIRLEMVDDRSIIIENRLNVLSNNLLQGIAFVVIILALFLSLRISLLVSFSIPISFLATIGIFYACGVSFNVVSLIGLIIVSGLLTDNAVVVVDNVSLLMKRGMAPIDAAVAGSVQVWRSITASTLGIVIAFLPMLFMTGIFGKIIPAIPIGVILALMMSLAVSFFILPAQFAFFVRDPRNIEKSRENVFSRATARVSSYWDDVVVPKYRRILVRMIRHRYFVAIGITVIAFGTLALLLMKLPKELFSSDGIEAFYIDTEVAVGTPLEQHAEMLKPIEAIVRTLPENELLNFNTTVGIMSEGPGDPETRRGDQYGRIKIFLTPESHRERLAKDIIEDLRPKVGMPAGFKHLTFGRVRAGPPQGKPISVGIRGNTFEQINIVAAQVKDFVRSLPGTSDIRDSFNPGKIEVQIKVDKIEASAAGLTDRDVARAVLAAYEGVEATSIRELDKEVTIRVQYPLEARKRIDSLNEILIQNKRGNLIPLGGIATWKEVPALASIEHEGFQRQVKITGDIDVRLNDAETVAAAVRAKVPEWTSSFPDVNFFFGGEDQDTRESFAALGRAFIVALIGIFLVLVLTFGTFLQPFLILITIPFGAVSALISFGLHGLPLSFFGMMGIIALGGVIVNNAIVLIDFVNQEREAGLDRFESIYEAGSRRLRAIFLSTITNIVGVIPTAYGFGGEDKFVIPIAIALGWGLALGSVLTAVFFPAFLGICDDLQGLMKRSKKVI